MKTKLVLKEGEITCPECNGVGFFNNQDSVAIRSCLKCDGTGYLDWLEIIMGKRKRSNTELINEAFDAMR